MTERSKEDVLRDIKLFVLDMDGTFYLGDQIIDGSLEFLEQVRKSGRKFMFFTNNSSKTPEIYVEKLSRMRCRIGPGDVMTSGDVTIRFLKTHYPEKTVYLMGTAALRDDFLRQKIRLTEDQQPDVVVVSFDMELTYKKLERVCTFIRNGAVFLATHLDINCPTETGFIPDCGAFCAAISLSTGKEPRYLGKPFADTPDMIVSATGFAKEEIAFVGDRLYTDVATGVKNGATGILVLSGETKPEDLEDSDIKPDAIFLNLGEMALYLQNI
ncbi:acid sugar phosphatase [Clostridia bacterium]|nr:acid sugar phosphatase [Clostridia bacterium]